MNFSKKMMLSLLSIPASAFMILIVYFLIYIFLGEQYYINEINHIENINILIKEFLVIGISMFMGSFYLLALTYILNNKNCKAFTKFISLILLALLITLLPIGLANVFFADIIIFQTTFIILWVIIVACGALILALKDFINVWIINKKLEK